MGADQSLLQFIELKEKVKSDEKWEWSLHKGQEKSGGRVSAFVYNAKILSKSKQKEEHLENVVKVKGNKLFL